MCETALQKNASAQYVPWSQRCVPLIVWYSLGTTNGQLPCHCLTPPLQWQQAMAGASVSALPALKLSAATVACALCGISGRLAPSGNPAAAPRHALHTPGTAECRFRFISGQRLDAPFGPGRTIYCSAGECVQPRAWLLNVLCARSSDNLLKLLDVQGEVQPACVPAY